MSREIAGVVLAAPLGLLVATVLPLAPGDPVRTVLVCLPPVLAALLGLGLWARRHGGRRTPPGVAAVEAAALGVLVLVALGRHSLGLRYSGVLVTRVVAAGFLLLLAHRVARLLIALRPALGRRLSRPAGPAFFFLPLVVYLALLPWQTRHRAPDGDEPYNLLVAHSLAFDFDTELSNNYAAGDSLRFMNRRIEPQPGDPRGPGGEIYSRHNMMLPLVLAPAYRLGGKTGALAVMAALTAALAWMTLRLARHTVPDRPGEALVAYALLAFSPPLLLYSYQVWVEVPAALLAAVALDRLLDLRDSPGHRPSWLLLGACLLLLPMLKLRFIVLSGSLLLAATLWLPRQTRRLLLAGAGLLGLLAGAILLFNELVFDHPLKHNIWRVLNLLDIPPATYLKGMIGVFYDSAFGLFATAPIWLLLWPAALLLARRRDQLGLLFLVVFGPYLLFVFSNHAWYGGWSPPMRYGLVCLPLLALALPPLLGARRRPGARALVSGLGALTLVLSLVWVVMPGWTYNLADGRSHLLDHLSRAVDADAARLFPSAVRPRTATWIWPPATALLVTALWWWPRGRWRNARLCGLAALVLAPAAVALAARHLPTRVVEFEDPWVRKLGGDLHPQRWTVSRHVFRGGWRLEAGDRVTAPVVCGARTLSLQVELRVLQADSETVSLAVASGERAAARQALAGPGTWTSVRFDGLACAPGAPLSLWLDPAGATGEASAAVLDRAVLDWD